MLFGPFTKNLKTIDPIILAGQIHLHLLTACASQRDLNTCPFIFLVLVVSPLYKATPDTPSSAATDLISRKQKYGFKRYL